MCDVEEEEQTQDMLNVRCLWDGEVRSWKALHHLRWLRVFHEVAVVVLAEGIGTGGRGG